MRRALLALAGLLLACAPAPGQVVSGDVDIARDTHGVIRIEGVDADRVTADFSARRPVTLTPFVDDEGVPCVAWSAPPGVHEIEVLCVDWDARSIKHLYVAVTVGGAAPGPNPPDVDPDPPVPPTPTPPDGPPRVRGSLWAVLLLDLDEVPVAVERILADPGLTRLRDLGVTWRVVDLDSNEAASLGYTRSLPAREARRLGIGEDVEVPAILYWDVAASGEAEVVWVEPATTTAALIETVEAMTGSGR